MLCGTRLAMVSVVFLAIAPVQACSSDKDDSLRSTLTEQLPEETKSRGFVMPNYLPPGTDSKIGVLPYPPNGISIFLGPLDGPGLHMNIIEKPIIGSPSPTPSLDPAIPRISWTEKPTVIKGRDVVVLSSERTALVKTDIASIHVLVQVDDPDGTVSLEELEREAVAILESMVDS
jgi:hypothetical protein